MLDSFDRICANALIELDEELLSVIEYIRNSRQVASVNSVRKALLNSSPGLKQYEILSE